MCEIRIEDAVNDLLRLRVACDAWRGQPGRAGELGDVLDALAAECERHAVAIMEIERRFTPLADDDNFDEHLDTTVLDVERCRDALFGPLPPLDQVVDCQKTAD
jgi:hypothetical protein